MDLFNEQKEIELSMANRGIDRYQRAAFDAAQNGEATRTKSVQVVMDTAIDAVTLALEAFREAAKQGKAGRRHSAIKMLEGLGSGEVSYLALRLVLDGLTRSTPLVPLACAIGRAVEMEARMLALEEKEGAYVRKLMGDLDSRTDHLRHRRAVLSKVLRERGDAWDSWTERGHLQLGLKMVELIVESTGLMTIEQQRLAKGKPIAVLVATPRFRDWLHSLDTKFALLAPEYLPCVIPPKDWTSPTDGGYHTDALAFPPTLVKTSNREHQKLLKRTDLTRVMAAVNLIQRTPWQINQRVLEVAEQLVEEHRAIAGLPPMDSDPLPAKPEDIDTNEEAKTAWKRAAAKVYDANNRQFGRRIGTLRNLHAAREFSRYERIYFPHQLDFRGRIYPIPQGLNPQGSDLGKALLRFADGDPLDTKVASDWFQIHGANCYGVDKVSFKDRIDWVQENAEHIIMSATDPVGYQWWADADSPFCFLAWAFEFNDWLAGGCRHDFISHIPVAMDGSCNGLQHYSAMLRDRRAGAATNLTPSEAPQDIYGEVAKVVMRKLHEISQRRMQGERAEGQTEEEVVAESLMAEAWLGMGIDRKITKRPVMVLPYGGTLRSCMDYVIEAVKERRDCPYSHEELPKAGSWLAKVVWEAIGEVVVSARLAMGWLKAAASKATKAGAPLVWTTPTGFPVMQAYPEMEMERIETFLMGQRFQPALQRKVDDKLDARRQANGVAPNFVHSLDASALMETVLMAADAGVTKFAMIHDSYGTTAGRSEVLAVMLRQAFVNLYANCDPLQDFLRGSIPAGARGDLTDPPFVGGLDLNEVLESRYFFA